MFISQGLAGSKGSLLAIRGSPKVLIRPLDADSDSEDEDMQGSRSSLSCLGLTRWTTEENLSSCSSREDRMDLVDEPLHDSHSNSTGEIM